MEYDLRLYLSGGIRNGLSIWREPIAWVNFEVME